MDKRNSHLAVLVLIEELEEPEPARGEILGETRAPTEVPGTSDLVARGLTVLLAAAPDRPEAPTLALFAGAGAAAADRDVF